MKSSYIWERFGWLFFTPKLFIKRRFFKNTSHACNTFQYTCFLVFNFALFCCFLFLFPSFIFVSFLVAINFLGVSFWFIKTKNKQNKTKQILFHNLVPRVFSLSNMAAAGEKTLAHSELKRSLIGAFHCAFIRALSLVYSFQNKDGYLLRAS